MKKDATQHDVLQPSADPTRRAILEAGLTGGRGDGQLSWPRRTR